MKVMLDTFSLFGWRSFFRGEIDVFMSINLAVKCGFDGIVVYGFGEEKSKYLEFVSKACEKIGLECHAHQVLGLDQMRKNRITDMLSLRGMIPKIGRPLDHQFHGFEGTKIVYGDYIQAASMDPTMWVKIESTVRDTDVRLFYKGIRDSAIAKSLPLVFDYQSQICQSLGFTDLEWVAKEKDVLYKIVSEEWLICKNNVRAIYLSDFSPRLGPEQGMNLELGKGIFPIRDFVQLVKRTGWKNGYVVPTVRPSLARYKRSEYNNLAQRLNSQVRRLFAQ